MIPYANLHGGSGVLGYELEPSSLVVIFRGGSRYRYSGADADRLSQLAQSGRGLNTFINVHKPSFVKLRP